MAKAGSVYPQVDPGARGLMGGGVAACPPRATIADALRLLERARAETIILRGGAAVRRTELLRAAAWGLGTLPVSDLAWTGLPRVPAAASETRVRRLLHAGTPMVLVTDGRRVVGVVEPPRHGGGGPALSVAHRLERPGDAGAERRRWLLAVAGKVGEALGTPAYAVGGFVRDLLLERDALDVDLVVEGDGTQFARRLAEEVGGTVVVHPGFGTASIEGATGGAGVLLGRVDIASARREEYRAPGALPTVSPARILEDLGRRDFSVNALAIGLAPGEFGRLLDPLGGERDLRRRLLRPLHPLSFTEDPTRVFRAARYAVRLRFGLDPGCARALKLALGALPYPALSGQRLRAEFELIVAEPDGHVALERLLRWGAFRLWDGGYRASRRGSQRLRAARRLIRWARRAGVGLQAAEADLLALLMDQPGAVADRCLERLAFTGEPLGQLRLALAAARPLARRLEGARRRRPSAVARQLRPCGSATIAAAWLCGGPRARRRIQWFLRDGHAVRPLLSGAEVMALGVPRGPAVAECLAKLRDRRLDGVFSTRRHEEGFVTQWLRARARAGMPAETRKGVWR